MPNKFFVNGVDIDTLFDPIQPQFTPAPDTGFVDDGTDISQLYAPVSVGSPAAATGLIADGVDIGNIFAAAGSVSLGYVVTPAANNVDEGSGLLMTVTGTNTPAGDLYWTINHIDTDASDFVAESGGPFAFNGTTGNFTITTTADGETEGPETFTVQVRTGSIAGTVVATSATITINDTSTGNFTLGGPNNMDEGVTVDFPFDGTGIPNQTYYWRIEYTGDAVAGDFTPPTSNSFAYSGSAVNIPITTVADAASEGSETFTLAVYQDAGYTQLAVNKVITINDTSSLDVSFDTVPASINEGASGNFTVAGTGSAQDLYWTIEHVTTAPADFSAVSGSFAFNGTTGSFDVGIVADLATEGSETFRVQLRSGSIAGPILDTSSNVTINDTSTGWSLVGPGSVNEGATATFNIAGGSAQNVYWTVDVTGGSGNDSEVGDFVAVTGGPVAYNGTSGNFGVQIVADATTEGTETFTVQLRTGSIGGPIVATSNSVTINDTSLDPTYNITGAPSAVDEGTTATFTVTTTNVTNGTILYWNTLGVSGTVNAADFQDGQTQGQVTINSNTGTILRAIANDLSVGEGTESFQLRLYTDAGRTQLVDTSNTITINDTSRVDWVGDTSYSWVATSGRPDVNQIGKVAFILSLSHISGTWNADAVAWEQRISDGVWQTNPGATTIYNGTWAVPAPAAGDYEVRVTYNSGVVSPAYFVGPVSPTPVFNATSNDWNSVVETTFSVGGNTNWQVLDASNLFYLLGWSNDPDGVTPSSFTIEIREVGGPVVITEVLTVNISATVGIPD